MKTNNESWRDEVYEKYTKCSKEELEELSSKELDATAGGRYAVFAGNSCVHWDRSLGANGDLLGETCLTCTFCNDVLVPPFILNCTWHDKFKDYNTTGERYAPVYIPKPTE